MLRACLVCFLVGPAFADTGQASLDDTRFASQIGAPAFSYHQPQSASQPSTSVDFRGTTGPSCASLDLDTFLNQFDPNELLAELRQTVLSGAQSAISNFILALAYSAPTLTSVLDMADRQVGSRFNAFAQTCASQQLRIVGAQSADRRIAEAGEQCFAQEVARGTTPTAAFRRCTVFRSFDALKVPASLSTLDFVRQHSDLAMTPRTESLLALLPDERIVAGSYQLRPPKVSLQSLTDSVRSRSWVALDRLLDASDSTVAECSAESLTDSSSLGCLPRPGIELIDSPAFRAARLLGPVTRSIFKDALSSHIAVVELYTDLLDLAQRIDRMNLRGDSNASGDEMQSRKKTLKSHVGRLLEEADLRMKLEEIRLQSARTQMIAAERAQQELRIEAEGLRDRGGGMSLGNGFLFRLFQDRD